MQTFKSQTTSSEKSGFFSLFSRGNGSRQLLNSVGGLISYLENVQANILVADMDLNIVYVNHSAVSTMEPLKNQIYEEFGVSLSNIVGGSIHRFHKDPQRIEKVLRNPSALPQT